MKYKNTSSGMVNGRPKKETDFPKEESIYHPKLGHLFWELDNGTIVICRSYKEYSKMCKGCKRDLDHNEINQDYCLNCQGK